MLVGLLTMKQGTPTEHVLRGLSMVSFMMPFLASILFCCLGWMASLMIRVLVEELQSKTNAISSTQFDEWMSFLEKLRTCYLFVIEFVDQISRQFGFVLLVVITSEFVRMTNTSFYLLMEFYNNDYNLHALLITFDFVKETVFFCVMVYIPSRIRDEVFSRHSNNSYLYLLSLLLTDHFYLRLAKGGRLGQAAA